MELGVDPSTSRPVGRIPRITGLMALAIRCDRLIGEGAITVYAELARLGHVTRPWITQIMNMLLLAPDIQETILNLPRITRGDDPIILRQVQAIAAERDWGKQRDLWRKLVVGPSLVKSAL
ncbi:hypothetical protein [Schlesneria sp.]|uniref:hypothetical protein n=1 Tax=Schlesneria sp. TaxID=2762018 RepID=UPI002EF8B86E